VVNYTLDVGKRLYIYAATGTLLRRWPPMNITWHRRELIEIARMVRFYCRVHAAGNPIDFGFLYSIHHVHITTLIIFEVPWGYVQKGMQCAQ
jgi:hypothetical protein